MKKLSILLFFLCVLSAHAQEFKKLKLTSNGEVILLKNVTYDETLNTVSYLDDSSQKVSLDLSNYDQVQYKKGSQWLAGMLGGMGGSILGSMIAGGNGNQEWWFGLAPKFLIGGGLGAAIGAIFPKYKNLEVGNKTKLEVGLNSVKLTF